jgi:sugar phosphate isomerase/epimerase
MRQAALFGSAAAVCTGAALPAVSEEKKGLPVVIFSKLYEGWRFSFDEAAELTAEAGLDGVDCPVRPRGEVNPDRVADDLPAYAEALRKQNLKLPFITTAILGTDTPQAEKILRTAKRLGVSFYRLGFFYRDTKVALDKQLAETKARLKDLAAMNREIGIGGVFENHSGDRFLGGDLGQLQELLSDCDPAQLGVALDIGHSLVVHGKQWRERAEKLKQHIQVAYVKDVTEKGQWVELGKGQVGNSGYFDFLRQINYRAPVSLHIEYPWAPPGQPETRDGLVAALKSNLATLRSWLRA